MELLGANFGKMLLASLTNRARAKFSSKHYLLLRHSIVAAVCPTIVDELKDDAKAAPQPSTQRMSC
jgi:hypothetical protein